MSVDIMQVIRQLQVKMVEQHSEMTTGGVEYDYDDRHSFVRDVGDIYTKAPAIIDPYSRINVQIFWGMAQLIQEMAKLLPNKMSDECFVNQIIDCQTASDARSHPLYQYLLDNITQEQFVHP